jgi:hypothetical protein
MLKTMKISHSTARQQHGVAIVEFAIVASLLFILLFGILEFGRLFYVFNSVQEVTRRAAREAVVRWIDQQSVIKNLALFGRSTLPAGGEITPDRINIEYLDVDGVVLTTLPISPGDNITKCLSDPPIGCIAYVRVSITGARYAPMVGLFSGIELTAFPFSEADPFRIDLRVPIPASTVTMPAESMGYSG